MSETDDYAYERMLAANREVRTVYMYYEEGQWIPRDEPLPPPPVCMFCGEPDPHLTSFPFGSEHDGEWICPACLDDAVDLLKGKKDGLL